MDTVFAWEGVNRGDTELDDEEEHGTGKWGLEIWGIEIGNEPLEEDISTSREEVKLCVRAWRRRSQFLRKTWKI